MQRVTKESGPDGPFVRGPPRTKRGSRAAPRVAPGQWNELVFHVKHPHGLDPAGPVDVRAAMGLMARIGLLHVKQRRPGEHSVRGGEAPLGRLSHDPDSRLLRKEETGLRC